MAFVLDASVALALVFPDEGAEQETVGAVERRLRREQAWVPAVWHLEVGNALLMAVRSGRIEEAVAQEALDLLSGLPVEVAGGARDARPPPPPGGPGGRRRATVRPRRGAQSSTGVSVRLPQSDHEPG